MAQGQGAPQLSRWSVIGLRDLVPAKWFPWVAAALTLLWLGWETSAVYSIVERHYYETRGLSYIAQETCQAVKALAQQDPEKCRVPQ